MHWSTVSKADLSGFVFEKERFLIISSREIYKNDFIR